MRKKTLLPAFPRPPTGLSLGALCQALLLSVTAHKPMHASNSDHANFSLRYFFICLHQLFIQPHLHLSAREMYFKRKININSFPDSQDGLSLSSHVPIKPNCLYCLLQSQVHFCQGDFVLLTYLLIFTHGKRWKLFTSSGLCSKALPEKGIPTAPYINKPQMAFNTLYETALVEKKCSLIAGTLCV